MTTDFLTPYGVQLEQVLHLKAFQLAASKVDKISGDIRICLDIMR
jgi:Cdc6-like AAA superfamily ATPase